MIICCGEALIDMMPRHIDGEGDAFLPIAGGAGFNTAIALGRLGEKTGFVSGISTDLFGDLLIDALGDSNVSVEYCVRNEQPTTLAFVKLTNGNAEYSFFDEKSAGRSLCVSRLPSLPDEVTALYFGAISLIPEPCGTAFETILNLHYKTKVISLDPNIRKSFITDATAHRQRIERMIARADIVKVSDEDLDWITSGEDRVRTIKTWIDQGTKIVLLTEGANGVTVYTGSGECHQPARTVEVKDTIGAGDTFNSGLLAGLNERGVLTKSALSKLNTHDLQHALQLATDAAAFTVSQAGANPPLRTQLSALADW